MKTRIVNARTAAQPASAYSQAIEVTAAARMLFISGQVGVAIDGSTPATALEQARLAWRNVAAQLEAAGMTLDNVVKTTIIVRDPIDLRDIATARSEALGDRRPASTLFFGTLVDPAWKVEIEAVACA